VSDTPADPDLLLTGGDLIEAAEAMLDASSTRSGGAAVALRRRAFSTAYYALLHEICVAFANAVVPKGCNGSPAQRDLWQRAFRTPQHETAISACKKLVKDKENADTELARFCATVIRLKQLRIEADFSPMSTMSEQDARALVAEADFLFFLSPPIDWSILVAELIVRPKPR
jgi:hypothetical protein